MEYKATAGSVYIEITCSFFVFCSQQQWVVELPTTHVRLQQRSVGKSDVIFKLLLCIQV